MIETRTTNEIKRLRVGGNGEGGQEVWVCLESLKKELFITTTGSKDFIKGFECAISYVNGLCNSQEQIGITGLTEQKDYEQSPKSVSCEHNTAVVENSGKTGEESTKVQNYKSVAKLGKSSPVQNPKDRIVQDIIKEDYKGSVRDYLLSLGDFKDVYIEDALPVSLENIYKICKGGNDDKE